MPSFKPESSYADHYSSLLSQSPHQVSQSLFYSETKTWLGLLLHKVHTPHNEGQRLNNVVPTCHSNFNSHSTLTCSWGPATLAFFQFFKHTKLSPPRRAFTGVLPSSWSFLLIKILNSKT